MKHIKKFNENNGEGFDIEYIKHCFAELDDEFNVETSDERPIKQDGKEIFILHVNLPRLNGRVTFGETDEFRRSMGFERSLKELIKNSEDLTRILKLCDIAANRLSDEYPNYIIGKYYSDERMQTRVNYRSKYDSDEPYLSIVISK